MRRAGRAAGAAGGRAAAAAAVGSGGGWGSEVAAPSCSSAIVVHKAAHSSCEAAGVSSRGVGPSGGAWMLCACSARPPGRIKCFFNAAAAVSIRRRSFAAFSAASQLDALSAFRRACSTSCRWASRRSQAASSWSLPTTSAMDAGFKPGGGVRRFGGSPVLEGAGTDIAGLAGTSTDPATACRPPLPTAWTGAPGGRDGPDGTPQRGGPVLAQRAARTEMGMAGW